MRNKARAKRRVFLDWENTHKRQISTNHNTKEHGTKEELMILQDNLDDNLHKNIKLCVSREITTFGGITVLITQMTWILLTQVQEIRSGFSLESTLMSGFGIMEIRSYNIWAYHLRPISKF